MNSSQILAEIREANMSYLMLAQALLRTDRAAALERLGIAEEAAYLIEHMSPPQLVKVASGNTLLCRIRLSDDLVWELITHHGSARDALAAGSAGDRRAA
ncbi:flagellar transcriptional regulator FlhD [Aquincola sp. MAHUQ-54]|uniref:Flagellar transcriptional regulator FlhD n=1 Tax=Aquincola agrisoli TaxID=3119538 RepID=A0AAW9QD03_9BURK